MSAGATARTDSVVQGLARGRLRGRLQLVGPAFVAAVAYVDPGNFATNISSGIRTGYLLLWVIVVANLMAVIVQYLSSKLGLVTGRSLPELCRGYPTPVRWLLWAQAEVVAMSTDLAEFVGAAVALNLLFGWPPLVAGLATAVAATALLVVQRRDARRFEIWITACLAVIVTGFVLNLALVDIVPADLVAGLVPQLNDDPATVLLAVGIIGATVMPHVVYLHSSLVVGRLPARTGDDTRTLLHFARLDVVLALLVAGAVNVAMLVIAAAIRDQAGAAVDSLVDAHQLLATTLGAGAATVFAIVLLASGLSSSSVGTLAGQVVMQGFIDRRIPLAIRRFVTLLPAMVVLAIGVEPTFVLVLSQVVLSIGIPFALIPLVHFSASRTVMGEFVNSRTLTAVAIGVTTVVVVMNVRLLTVILGGP